jgi:hypothetical protein
MHPRGCLCNHLSRMAALDEAVAALEAEEEKT